MKKLINMTTSGEDLDRYQGVADLEQFITRHGCNGLEVMPLAGTELNRIPQRLVTGVHLNFQPTWMDLWMEDETALIKEYGTLDCAAAYYGDLKRSVLVDGLRRDLAYAKACQASYTVFHVSEIATIQLLDQTYHYTDEQVIEAACDIINQAMQGEEYPFEFLVENLWWPGFKMTDVSMTRKLLDGINCQKKGIMMDTGHLLHTNLELNSQAEAVDCVMDALAVHEEMLDNIRGIHLNQSLSGAYVKKMMAENDSFPVDYTQRMELVYPYIFRIDQHLPFTDQGVKEIIEKAAPEYLVYEFITENREMHERYLQEQVAALGS